jgi:hypothetical protein
MVFGIGELNIPTILYGLRDILTIPVFLNYLRTFLTDLIYKYGEVFRNKRFWRNSWWFFMPPLAEID